MSKKKSKKVLGIELKSNPKKGLVGFLIRKKIVRSVTTAEIFLLAISMLCFSTSIYILNESFPLVTYF